MMLYPLKDLKIITGEDGSRLNPRDEFELEALIPSLVDGFDPDMPIEVLEMPDGSFGISDGERRIRAAKAAGLDYVCIEIKGKYVDYGPNGVVMIAMTRGNQLPLRPLEIGRGAAFLLKGGVPLPVIARKCGKSVAIVSACISLLGAPASIRNKVNRGELSITAWNRLKSAPIEFQENVGNMPGKATKKKMGRLAPPANVLPIPQNDVVEELNGIRLRLESIVSGPLDTRVRHVLARIAEVLSEPIR